MMPPAPPEATRNVTLLRSSRLYGLNEIQSPSSMKAADRPPPTSVVVSVVTPGSPVPRPSAVRPVVAKYSACLSLGCRITSALPVTGAAGPLPASV